MPRSLQLRTRASNREGDAPGSARPIGLDAANTEQDARPAVEEGATAVALVQDWFGNLEVQHALTSPPQGLDGAITGAVLLEEAGIGDLAREGLRSNATMLSGWRGQREPGMDLEDPAVRQLGPTGGRPMPDAVRERMEEAFGHGFEHVRIHADSQAARAADALNARAFALGSHLFFGSGAWAPGTPDGDRVLAHELTHVQQHDEGALSDGHGVSEATDRHEQEAYGNEDRILGALSQPSGEGEATAAEAEQAATPTASSEGLLRYTEAEDREGDRAREAVESALEGAREDRSKLRALLDALERGTDRTTDEAVLAGVDLADLGRASARTTDLESLAERAREYLAQAKQEGERPEEEAEEAPEGASTPQGVGEPADSYEQEADQVAEQSAEAAAEDEQPGPESSETEATRRLATGHWEAAEVGLALDLEQDGGALGGRYRLGGEDADTTGTISGTLDHDDEQETVFSFEATPESGSGEPFAGILRIVESGALSLEREDGARFDLACAAG